MISYADFITLMFALFVVLFSSSQVDKRKVGQMARAIQVAFAQLGIFPPAALAPPREEIKVSAEKESVIRDQMPADGFSYLLALKQKLESLVREDSGTRIRFKMDRRGLVISLAEAAFFDSGSAAVKPESRELLDKVAALLSDVPNHIRVEGHTDNVPISNSRFPNNWELSTARATSIVTYLITNFGYPPDRLSAAGYGEYRPIASNDTPEGRALNRRVDIVVLNELAADQEPEAIGKAN